MGGLPSRFVCATETHVLSCTGVSGSRSRLDVGRCRSSSRSSTSSRHLLGLSCAWTSPRSLGPCLALVSRLEPPSLEFLSHLATSAREVLSQASQAHDFRPRRFSRPRRLLPSLTLRACFIPLPRPGFALQGLACGAAVRALRSPLPSCRFDDFRVLLRTSVRGRDDGLTRGSRPFPS